MASKVDQNYVISIKMTTPGAIVVMPTPPAAPPASNEAGPEDSAATDLLHQERMEYIKQLVQERERLSAGPGCDVAKRLIEQGKKQNLAESMTD